MKLVVLKLRNLNHHQVDGITSLIRGMCFIIILFLLRRCECHPLPTIAGTYLFIYLFFSFSFEFKKNNALIRCSSLPNRERIKEIFPQNSKSNEKNGSLQLSVTVGPPVT